MQAKRFLIIGVVLLAGLLLVLASCGTGGEDEEDDQGIPPFEDDDVMDPPTGDDDDNGGTGDDDTADDDWPEEACNGDSQPHEIIYTTWAELGNEMKNMLIGAFDGEFEARDFFGRWVYWYGVLRECSRSLRDYYKSSYPEDRWTEETTAAQMAVAYMRERAELLNIGLLHAGVVDLYEQLDDPVPALSNPEDYFNNNEADILNNPAKYLWYQLHWAKEALGNINPTAFGQMLKTHLCVHVNANTSMDPVAPHSGFDSPSLATTVFETLDEDLRLWFVRLDPQLQLRAEPSTLMIFYE